MFENESKPGLIFEEMFLPNLLVDLVRPEDQEDLEDPAILSLLELLVVQLGP